MGVLPRFSLFLMVGENKCYVPLLIDCSSKISLRSMENRASQTSSNVFSTPSQRGERAWVQYPRTGGAPKANESCNTCFVCFACAEAHAKHTKHVEKDY